MEMFNLGSFPCLQHFHLVTSDTLLNGDDFPCLESLIIENSEVRLLGHFPALRYLRFHDSPLDIYMNFTAPNLKEISLDGVTRAHNFVINRVRFPKLQLVSIMQRVHQDYSMSDPTNYPILLEESKMVSPRPVVLKLDSRTPETEMNRLRSAVPNWLLFITSFSQRGIRPKDERFNQIGSRSMLSTQLTWEKKMNHEK